MIYQEDTGRGNSGKLPSGGVIAQPSNASSMNETIANPITFYANPVINQSGQSRDLYDYYWSSYSRGTDGQYSNVAWHNDYLDSYIPLRHKSIYDPCPYGYRIPSNGTYNEFTTHTGWIIYSYIGGLLINNSSWYNCSSRRDPDTFKAPEWFFYQSSSVASYGASYSFAASWKSFQVVASYSKLWGFSVRCIEDCSVVSDATEASAGY